MAYKDSSWLTKSYFVVESVALSSTNHIQGWRDFFHESSCW